MTEPVFGLPSTWQRVSDQDLAHGLSQARSALDPDTATDRLRDYFDEAGNYAGALFNTIEPATFDPDPDNVITPGDLLAVATLAIDIGPLQARQLLTPGMHQRGEVRRLLRLIPGKVSLREVGTRMGDIADPGLALLSHMSDLQDTLRETGPDRKGGDAARHWVFASKLSARKRPELIPIRDNVVCKHLSLNGRLSARGGAGTFRHDIQVIAHIIADPDTFETIRHLRGLAEVPVAVPDLRVLDVALWMAAVRPN